MNPVKGNGPAGAAEAMVRAATRAQAAQLREVRPLRLRPAPGAPPGRAAGERPRRARRPRSWLAPVAAAAAVLAIAASLVTLRVIPNGRGLPPPGKPAAPGVPAYYVALSGLRGGWTAYAPLAGPAYFPVNVLVVGATFTGKKVATIAPPHGATFMGVTAAADDRTFVVDAAPNARLATAAASGGSPFRTAPRTWYRLRVSPGSTPGYRLTRLPVPVTPRGTEVGAISLSPDGTELAVALRPRTGPQLLRVYAVATGQVLRSTTVPWGVIGGASAGSGSTDDHTAMSWADGGRELAVNLTETAAGRSVLLLDLAAPARNPFAGSREIWPQAGHQPAPAGGTAGPASLSCATNLVITPDGSALACGATATLRAPGGKTTASRSCPAVPPWNVRAFLRYSTTTAQPAADAVGRWQTSCGPLARSVGLLWVSQDGATLLGFMTGRGPAGGTVGAIGLGIFTAAGYRPLPGLPSGITPLNAAW